MNRFERVVQILDEAVGGPAAPVSFHGAFWRNVTRDAFVARSIFGLPLIAVGNGTGSTLVKALKGRNALWRRHGQPGCRLQPDAVRPSSGVRRRHRLHREVDR